MDRPRTTFTRTALAGLVLAAGALACDDETTGTADARVSASVHDQNPEAQEAALASLVPLQVSSDFTGTVSGDARVDVSADGETWVELGEASEVDVELQSSDEETSLHTEVSAPLESFAMARLVLDGADAEIEAGSTIGGTTLETGVTISLGGPDQVVVEKQLGQTLVLNADSEATLTFDLNSEAWVTEENVDAGVVAESEIESATEVTVSGS